ncbi:hypothetical protein O181_033650 [Austropuccinia psidii MF-1]|uniref:Reverse transcriptase/retrotransposon-derived protein RNase H-like domain-containing protein n=1 Tax=Austropuccinia psidii MF-1 TaxID=1389203 RepID=A0A9Q3D1L7_9BASI|nr:hypothetical protein [Austropuccinia psidii MF-1]
MTQERIEAYEEIRKAFTEAPLLLMPYWNIPFELYIDSFGDGLGAALHQVQIIDDKRKEGPVCYISRQTKLTEARYGATRWSAYVYSMKSLLNMKTPNKHRLRWKNGIQEYRGNITIVHKEGNIHNNADGLSRWALTNTSDNPDYVPLEAEPQIPT